MEARRLAYQGTATHYSTLQHTASHCINTLQHAATPYSRVVAVRCAYQGTCLSRCLASIVTVCCSVLHRVAVRCSTSCLSRHMPCEQGALQVTWRLECDSSKVLQHVAACCCSELQCVAVCCALQVTWRFKCDSSKVIWGYLGVFGVI